MSSRLALLVSLSLAVATPISAQMSVAEPFKVGTFEIEGVAQVGIVLRDQCIVELSRANEALRRLRSGEIEGAAVLDTRSEQETSATP